MLYGVKLMELNKITYLYIECMLYTRMAIWPPFLFVLHIAVELIVKLKLYLLANDSPIHNRYKYWYIGI